MHENLARGERVGGDEAFDGAGEGIIRQGQDDKIGLTHDLVRRQQWHARKQFFGAAYGRGRDPRCRDHVVASTGEGGTENAADATR
ncbi:hypothetical protein GCM10025762_39580 [Haloechinothrix salitolerans]